MCGKPGRTHRRTDTCLGSQAGQTVQRRTPGGVRQAECDAPLQVGLRRRGCQSQRHVDDLRFGWRVRHGHVVVIIRGLCHDPLQRVFWSGIQLDVPGRHSSRSLFLSFSLSLFLSLSSSLFLFACTLRVRVLVSSTYRWATFAIHQTQRTTQCSLCSWAHFGCLTTACLSSLGNGAVSISSHMQQDIFGGASTSRRTVSFI